MSNEHLQNAAFWESVEGDEVLELIEKLDAIPEASRTKGERNKLAKAYIRLKQVRIEAERLAALNKKWQTGHLQPSPIVGTGVEIDGTDIFSNDDTPVTSLQEPGKLYCKFCGKPVDAIHATRGTGKIAVTRSTDPVLYNGKVIAIEETTHVQAEKVLACPACAHLVAKPSVATRV